MKHYPYPKIGQFKDAIGTIKHLTRFLGNDPETGENVFDHTIDLPTLTFEGTTKLHGTNAAIVFSSENGVYAQSRDRVLEMTKDNAGFNAWMESNREEFENNMQFILPEGAEAVVVFGEWCGPKTCNGHAAIHNLPTKMFFPFAVQVIYNKDSCTWLTDLTGFEWLEKIPGIKLVQGFAKQSITIDFENPQLVQNKLIELTNEVEAECPVAAQFGIKDIGEGIVWKTHYNGQLIQFKVKGDAHAASKTKTLAPVDEEKLTSVAEFVDYAVTENRVKQAIQSVFGDETPTKNKTGDVLKWVMDDVVAEETKALVANGLCFKDVASACSNKVRKIFFSLID